MNSQKTTRIAVLGASGYVGGQLLALLAGHPNVNVTVATSVRYAGQSVAQVYPALAPLKGLILTTLDATDIDAIADQADLVLSALPHGHSATVLGELVDRGVKVCDLSADYRFSDARAYAAAYGPHPRPDLTPQAVYGLVEFNRKAIAGATLVGVPGCYPTATLLALLPALQGGFLDHPAAGVVVDAKSGISGAGREAKTGNLFCEVDGGIKAYNVGVHRHQPEMAFQAEALGNTHLDMLFVPQVVPMVRGILSCVYFKLKDGADAEALRGAYQSAYADTPFGQVLETGDYPSTKRVAGTNRFDVAVTVNGGQVAALCAIDNLIKGAAGQGIQCMNLMLGLPEETGLPTMGRIV